MSSTSFFKRPSFGNILSAAGSLIGGLSAYQAGQRQAEEIQFQGQMALQEAFRSASIVREEGRDFAATQSLQFIGSGVELAGSALITIAQTKKYADTEAQALEAQGEAVAAYASRRAAVAKSEGRASLIGSIFSAGASLFSGGI